MQAQDSRIAGTFVSLSLGVLKFVLERGGVALGDGDGGGYLSGEDARGGREAVADRDGGGVLIGGGGGGDAGGGRYLSGEDVRGGGSDNEKIFLVYKEEEEE